MNKPHWFLALLLCTQWAVGQTLDSVPLLRIDSVRSFAVDPLQHLLIEHEDGSLIKYSPQGTPQFHFHNTVLGELTSVDASDPFNILLFFAEQQTIVQLDRTLGETALLDLRTTALLNATAICRNFDNNIWVYDDFNSKLYLLDARGRVLQTSNDLRISERITEAATHIWREGDLLYLNFPQRGIASFDLNAQLKNWWAIPAVQDAYFHKGVFCFQADSSAQYQATLLRAKAEPVPLKLPYTYSVLRQSFDLFYLLMGGELVIYQRREKE